MYQEDNYNPADPNDYDNELIRKENILENSNSMDRGYNVIYRNVIGKDEKIKKRKIRVYTSSDIGNHIRDAETGEYYPNLVGSKDEDLFYKVGLSTGECNSANGSNTLFYLSPQHYASHLHCNIDPEHIETWELKRKARLDQLNSVKKTR